jgi:FxsC-like protein
MSNVLAADKKNYFFFLSYSRRDAKNNLWFKRFYEDLTRDVAARAGVPVDTPDDNIRFFDREAIETGDVWYQALEEGLQTSNVFVPLYSVAYFKSEYCGKEYRAFQDRVREYEKTLQAQTGTSPPRLIIPVLWGNPKEIKEYLPQAISSIQFSDAELGDLYTTSGLEQIMRLEENRAYQQFLLGMKDKVVKEAERHPLPRAQKITPLADVCSAFITTVDSGAAGVIPAGAGASPTTPDVAGPEVAWFVYVAGGPADFTKAQIERSHACYGKTGGFEWQPYFPNTKKIGIIATSIASEKQVFPHLLPVSDQLIEQLEDAEENNTIVVLIIDPWSLKLYKRPMSEYDKTRLSNCGIVVIWNDSDPETQQKRDDLELQLRQTFSRSLISRDVFFKESSSELELRENLSAAIDDVCRKVGERAKLVRGPIAGESETLPSLPVPSSEDAPALPAVQVTGGL